MRGRSGEIGGCKALALGLGQFRRRVAIAGEQRPDRIGVEAAGLFEGTEHFGARRRLAHQPGGRTLAAERVIDEARDRRPVARSRKAMREAPVLQRVGGGTAARLDLRQNVDRGGDAGGGGHGIGFPAKGTPSRRRGKRPVAGGRADVQTGLAAVLPRLEQRSSLERHNICACALKPACHEAGPLVVEETSPCAAPSTTPSGLLPKSSIWLNDWFP